MLTTQTNSVILSAAEYGKMVGHLEHARDTLRQLAYCAEGHAAYETAMKASDEITRLLADLDTR